MNKGKLKKKKIIITLLVTMLLVCVFIYFINSNIFVKIYGKFYTGDHIELDLSIYYKGELITGDSIDITCINPQGKNEQINRDTSKYSVKGGEYGKYVFSVTIKNKIEETVVLELEFLNANDWYISKSRCVIEIDELDGELNCNYEVTTKYNDGTSLDYSEKKTIKDGKVEFSWGI